MKKIITAFLLILGVQKSSGTITTLFSIDFEVLANTGTTTHPGVAIEEGQTASFRVTYDPASLPSISASTSAVYDLLGNATLQINGYSWSSSSFQIEISNNRSFIPPAWDQFAFRAEMMPDPLYGSSSHDVMFQVNDDSNNLTFLSSTDLPQETNDLDLSTSLLASFQINPPVGAGESWLISGGPNFNSISITTIPEPSTSFLFLSFLGLLIWRRRS